MPELAQVVVDVPTMQTNQPYTYQIPPKLEKQIQVGVRVIVPLERENGLFKDSLLPLTMHPTMMANSNRFKR